MPSTGNRKVDSVLDILTKEVQRTRDSVGSEKYGYDYKRRPGDVKFVLGADKKGYLECEDENGTYTTFVDVFQRKTNQTPYPYFDSLFVDNFTAYHFVLRETTGLNGDQLISNAAEVESTTTNTITFKDPSNFNLCPFSAGDLIEARRAKQDNSLNIKLTQATVSSVSGRTTTVTYNSGEAKAGDVFVRVGNTGTVARQNSIFMSTDDTNAPFIDFYQGISSWGGWNTSAGGKTTTRLGKLDGITDSNFGALSGNGLYSENIYLKGNIIIANPEDIDTSGLTNDAGWTTTKTYRQTTEPVSGMAENDIWYDTDDFQVYRYSGSAWEIYGADGTFIDGSGIYTGTLTAVQVNAVAINADSITTGTLTGRTVRTASSGQRVVLDGSTNKIEFYNDSNQYLGGLIGEAAATVDKVIYLDAVTLDITSTSTTSINAGSISLTGNTTLTGYFSGTSFIDATSGFRVNGTEVISSGRALNNITDYGLAASDIPVHNNAWSTITSTPTTISGYGITDASWGSSLFSDNWLSLTDGGDTDEELQYAQLTIGGVTKSVLLRST